MYGLDAAGTMGLWSNERHMARGEMWGARGTLLRALASLRRDRDQWQVLSLAGVGKREEHHRERERSLGSQIAIIDPEPMIAVVDQHERVVRLLLRRMDLDESRGVVVLRSESLPPGRDPALRDVFARHLNLRRHRLHEVKDRARQHRDLPVVTGGGGEDELERLGVRVQSQQLPQLVAVLQSFRRDVLRAERQEGGLLLLLLIDGYAHADAPGQLKLAH